MKLDARAEKSPARVRNAGGTCELFAAETCVILYFTYKFHAAYDELFDI